VNSYSPNKNTENYALEHSTQPMLSRLPAQNTKMYSSELESHNKWTTVSSKRGRPTQEEASRKAKLFKERNNFLNPTLHTTAFQPYWKMKVKTNPGNTPKPPAIFVSDVTTIPPFIQMLEQIAKLQYEIKALTCNQVKIQPKLWNFIEQSEKPYPRNTLHSTYTNQKKNETTEKCALLH
jgi:hypothetical protein